MVGRDEEGKEILEIWRNAFLYRELCFTSICIVLFRICRDSCAPCSRKQG